MLKIFFHKPWGIGDKIATIYCMENCGRQTGEKFLVCGESSNNSNSVTEEIVNLFNLNYVSFTNDCSKSILSLDIRGKVSSLEYVEEGYIHYISRIKRELQEKHNFNPKLATALSPKNSIKEKGDYVVCQFDSRFARTHGFALSERDIKFIISKHISKEKIIIIGGTETSHYMNHIDKSKYDWKYDFGNFQHSLDLILKSNRFVGADSGMSHLAGAVGVETHTYFLVPKWYAKGGLNRNDGQSIPDELILEGGDINPSLTEYYECYINNYCYGRQDFCRKTFL